MARPLRVEFPGAVYHVTSRGDGRDDIYLCDGDREIFFAILINVIERFQWRCHAYCLMSNHYHLLIETPLANLSRGMRQLNGVYTQRFNRTHGRVGHVFQGRYKAILVEKQAHLLELCRYVVLNPVRAGMVENTRDWPWSSYCMTAGILNSPDFVHTKWILEQFGRSRRNARERYRQFVREGDATHGPWENMTGPDVLGSEEYRSKLQGEMGSVSEEVPRRKRWLERPSLPSLQAHCSKRGEWMSMAYRKHGYSMREIALQSGMHYSSVSKIIKGWESEQKSTFKT